MTRKSKSKSKDVSSRRRKMKSKSRVPWTYVLPAIVVLVIVTGILYFNSVNKVNSITIPIMTPPSLSDMAQMGGSPSGYHWHVHLDILVNGTHASVPNGLGF